MNTPILTSIRIRYSETAELHGGQQFDTIADFDATLRAASFAAPADGCYQKVSFVMTWNDGGTFQGRIDLERHQYDGLVPHVIEVCDSVLREPRLRDLVVSARLTRARIIQAAAEERLAECRAREAAVARQLKALRAQIMHETN